jgi:hypothetical protein
MVRMDPGRGFVPVRDHLDLSGRRPSRVAHENIEIVGTKTFLRD